MAVFNKFEATAKLLLDKGAEVDSRNYSSKSQTRNTALQIAVNKGDVGFVRLFLHCWASPTEKYITHTIHTTVLHIAAADGCAEIVFVVGERSQNLGDR